MLFCNIKNLIKGICLIMQIALLINVVDVNAKGISGASVPQGERVNRPTMPSTSTSTSSRASVQAADENEYVQTEAHLQRDDVKEKMAQFIMRVPGDRNQPEFPRTPNQIVTPHLNIVSEVINKEVQFRNSHYAFYNASNNEWRVPQDLYKKLYIHYKKVNSSLNDFAFMRFTDAKSINAQDFLKENIAKWGGVNDNIQTVRDVVMSVNIALFGNVGFPGECTWNYFLEAKSHRWPLPTNYYDVLKSFDITYDIASLAKEAQALSEMLVNASPEQTLFQFLIPQDKVDDVAYVAWILGFPAHPESMELAKKLLEGKPRVGAFTGKAVKDVMKRFKKDRDNSVYKDLIKSAATGKFGVSGFMETMCNNPFELENLNETQARIMVTNDMFRNPSSGIKIFTYFTTPKNIQEEYERKLNALAQKIISQESAKSPEQKNADRANNEAIYKRVQKEEQEKADKEKAKK